MKILRAGIVVLSLFAGVVSSLAAPPNTTTAPNTLMNGSGSTGAFQFPCSTSTPTNPLTLCARNFLPSRVVTAAGTVVVSSTADYVIVLNKGTPAATSVTMPASPATGATFIIKDGAGNANAFPITINGNGNNIDGSSTYVMAVQYQSTTIIFNGTQWNVL